MFCDKCGSNMMQRVACSVDRGTGRLKLHLKRNYRVNTRGTKFSLPKPGKVREHVVPHDDID
jgi:RNA-binding protein NOB1